MIDKAEEEIRELREAVANGGGKSPEAEEEFGDLLFSLVNVARKLGIEPEAALRVANDKFQRRFDDVERQVAASGKKFRDLTLEQLEEHWQRAKLSYTKDTKTRSSSGRRRRSRRAENDDEESCPDTSRTHFRRHLSTTPTEVRCEPLLENASMRFQPAR